MSDAPSSTSAVSLRQLGGWALFAAGSLLGLGDAARWMLSHG